MKGCVFQLDGSGSNPRGGELFRSRPNRPYRPPSLLHNGYLVIPGNKATGAWPYPTTSSSVEVKESAQLFLYSLSCAFIAGHRVKFSFFACFNCDITEVRTVTENSNTAFETPFNWCFHSMDLIWVIPVLQKWYEMCRSFVIWIWFVWSACKSSQLDVDIYVNIYRLIMRHAVEFI